MAADPCFYVIDTCAIMDLNGDNVSTSYTNDLAVRERIWKGIEELVRQGRMCAVYAQKDEMERRCPDGHDRLRPLHDVFYQTDNNELLIAVRAVLEHTNDRTRRRLATRKPNREPADPYIVGFALQRGYQVVTNEKHRNERIRDKSKQSLPDLCDAAGVVWLHLAELVTREKL